MSLERTSFNFYPNSATYPTAETFMRVQSDHENTLKETRAYIDYLINATNDPDTSEIRLMNVAMRWGYPSLQKLGHALIAAANRGVRVHLVTSWVSELGLIPLFDNWSREDPIEKNDYNRSVEEEILYEMYGNKNVKLETAFPKGIQTAIIPLLGNNHRKLALIKKLRSASTNFDQPEDQANCAEVWFGKSELGSCFTRADGMYCTTNPIFVDYVEKVFNGNSKELPRIMQFEPDSYILHDPGTTKYSIIQEAAQFLVTNATKSVTLLSQVPPTGKLLRLLKEAATRGVEINIITADEDNSRSPIVRPTRVLSKHQLGSNSPINFTELAFPVHAGILFVDDCEVIFGSGNFNGVFTHVSQMSDISMYTRNPDRYAIISQFAQHIINHQPTSHTN